MSTSSREAPPPHDPIIKRVDVATSSSDLAWKAAGEGAPHGAGFLVAEQTAGRGRRGATWRSVRGGMYFSILLRPGFEQRLWPGLSFIAGLAIREVIAGLAPENAITLKWPNDVIAMKGKIGGVLLEARGDAVVVGTGVNIKQQETMPKAKLLATSIAEMGAGEIAPFDIAEAYARNLLGRVERYGSEGFGPAMSGSPTAPTGARSCASCQAARPSRDFSKIWTWMEPCSLIRAMLRQDASRRAMWMISATPMW